MKDQDNINWDKYDGPTGLEDEVAKDFGLPFFKVLQDLSPEVKKTKAKFIVGAEIGDIVNTLTNEVIFKHIDPEKIKDEEMIRLIICKREFAVVEYIPRSAGGGFVAAYREGSEEYALVQKTIIGKEPKTGNPLTSKNTELVTTIYLYCVYYIGNDMFPCVIALTSTQLKKWQFLHEKIKKTKVGEHQIPMFGVVFGLYTQPESNVHGDWFGFAFKWLGIVKSISELTQAKGIREEEHKLMLTAAAAPSSASETDAEEVFG